MVGVQVIYPRGMGGGWGEVAPPFLLNFGQNIYTCDEFLVLAPHI